MITPSTIRQARTNAGLTQREAAELLGVKERRWQSWEQGERNMPRQLWELWCLKVRAWERGKGIP